MIFLILILVTIRKTMTVSRLYLGFAGADTEKVGVYDRKVCRFDG